MFIRSLTLVLLVLPAGALWPQAPSIPAPTTLNDFFLPGSQPNQSGQLETPGKCDNCHGGYDTAVEPAFNWRGSMMAQAARDPLFYASMAIANQDAPESGDLCIRCHSPAGWLEGRSSPTDGSALNSNDRQGVQCDFCHKLVKPTPIGVNPYPGDAAYTSATYPQDQSYLSLLSEIPPASANGMYIADANNAKRGPFTDAAARHQVFYSPFHRDAALCGTCHDVSNPVFSRIQGGYAPNDFGQPAPSFSQYRMFPLERTFSEWRASAYARPDGATCQDCHMRDVTGVGCNKQGAPVRTDLPLHDLTGGNTFVPLLLPALWPSEVNVEALTAGIQRATAMLQQAASLYLVVNNTMATVRVVNETGHKLPSGYPEGRRAWLNVKAFDASGALLREFGAYNFDTAELIEDDTKVYEVRLGIDGVESFHFVLNNSVVKDNRIPPRGFNNYRFSVIQSPPVGYSYADGQYWDDTQYSLPPGTARVVATMYYQTIHREYAEFLRDENHTNNWGQVFYDLWAANGKSAPVPMATAVWPGARGSSRARAESAGPTRRIQP